MLFYRGNLERGWPFLIFDRLLLQAQWGDVSSFSMFPLNPGRSNILLVNIFFWCQWCDAWIKYNGKIWEHQKWSYWHVQDDIQKAQQGWPQKEGTIIFHVLTSLFGGMSFIYVDCPNSGGGDFIYPLVSKLSPFCFFLPWLSPSEQTMTAGNPVAFNILKGGWLLSLHAFGSS